MLSNESWIQQNPNPMQRISFFIDLNVKETSVKLIAISAATITFTSARLICYYNIL